MTGAPFARGRHPRSRKTPRTVYEYRCWPPCEGPLAGRLERDWRPVRAETRADIYLLSAISDSCLVRLRDGVMLEIKSRFADAGPLQCWTMARSVPFPMSPDDFLDVAVSLGLSEMPEEQAALSPAHLLSSLGAASRPVVAQSVTKSRLLFERGICRTELCKVRWAGGEVLSLAVSDPCRQGAMAAVRELGLERHRNQSYGEFLVPPPLSVVSASSSPA
ncbi:hypothetical protein [Roseovarius salis]|uniref:hypothetical protein n=1 Tax=Roseovarius salis TaxID=3376063 RepID=UPI0037C8ED08